MYQQDKDIMLSRDLLPCYKVGDKLSINAMGNDGVQPHFQWYYAKNQKAALKGKFKLLRDAVGATLTAEKPGYYYCVASAGNTALTTSTTEVK
jgi:hypothetical protein